MILGREVPMCSAIPSHCRSVDQTKQKGTAVTTYRYANVRERKLFYCSPQLAPDAGGFMWMPDEASEKARF